ncbi:hypothetical protein TYRP_021797 [Tyrophagus putrescentiae]|nr:hypothetical protein TYRP_021797 [Tyrophagus putrescentiae]
MSISGGTMAASSSSAAGAIPQYATTVTNVTFAYGRGKKAVNALNDITIKVPVGSIYGILGPSGCGKSTLVHCLVGSLKPKRGIVKVFGEVPGSHRALVPGPGVGYMPQEIGLFNEFTIQETLFFFGRLYRLPAAVINGRIAFLISFLELPDKSAMVGKLSGGQARRVSLAAALVHKPPLLVLDEPTVGIDPVLRQSIWSHLRSLTDEHGITVIITTHYIEEARLANLVAFMRHGSLLEEGNPESLIRRLRLNNLEEVFLALCRNKKTSEEKKGAIIKKPLLEKDKDVEMMMIKEGGGGGEEEELLSVSIQKSEGDEEAGSSSSTALPAPAEPQCTTVVTTSVPVPSQPPTETAVVCTTFSSEDLENGGGNISSSSEKTSPVITANNSKTTAHSPTSPIFSHTQQHRKMQDAQVMANRLLMKRNAILDHFARSSALLTKNFIRMWRNLPVMLFTAFIPAVQCSLFFLCLGRPPYDIPVSVYNAEQPPQYSRDFLQSIDNRTIDLRPVNSFEAGYQAVWGGESRALITIGSNFSAALYQKSVDLLVVDNETLDMAKVNLYLDMSSQFHAGSIREKVYEAFGTFARRMLVEHGMEEKLADPPIHIGKPILGQANPTVTEFMAPGFILSLAFFASIATAALTLVLERKDGLLERSLVSGVNPTTSSSLPSSSLRYRTSGRSFWISVLIVMQGVCGMSYGVLISAIAKEESFTLAACMGSMFPQFLLSGVVWPVDTMPPPLVFIANFFSQAKSLEAVRYMLYRGWDPLHHFDVAIGFIISASWTIVFLFIATILFNVHKS